MYIKINKTHKTKKILGLDLLQSYVSLQGCKCKNVLLQGCKRKNLPRICCPTLDLKLQYQKGHSLDHKFVTVTGKGSCAISSNFLFCLGVFVFTFAFSLIMNVPLSRFVSVIH